MRKSFLLLLHLLLLSLLTMMMMMMILFRHRGAGGKNGWTKSTFRRHGVDESEEKISALAAPISGIHEETQDVRRVRIHEAPL